MYPLVPVVPYSNSNNKQQKHHPSSHFSDEMAEDTAELHPLQHEWVLWEREDGAQSSSDWNEQMNEICSFSTIEEFWCYFNHIPKPSEIFYDGETRKKVGPTNKAIVEYDLFKKGIKPEWGDPQNATGGSFTVRQQLDTHTLDIIWQNMVMGLIGETIENDADATVDKSGANCICGGRIVDKGTNMPTFRVELWINSRDANVKERIRKKLVECLMDGLERINVKGLKFDWRDHSN